MPAQSLHRNFLSDLNDVQREAVIETEGPMLILAGAGTGKTRVITYRIAYLLSKGISPYNILAITFTNKAAEEMKSRVVKLAPGVGERVCLSTFHSFAARLLKIEAKAAGLKPDFLIYDETDQKNVIKQCLKELGIDDKKYKVGIFLDAISRSKDDLIDAGSYTIYSAAQNDIIRNMISNVYQKYQKMLTLSGALDFGDLLLKCVELFYSNKEVLEKYQERFKYVLVDEYQDTNRAQYVMLKYLAAKNKNLCVVGDDDQSIYSWRGADVKNILGFEKDYPDTKVIKLEQNYRSTKKILNCAWGVIRNNNFRKEKRLWTNAASGEDVKIFAFDNEIAEANFIAKEIKKIISSRKNVSYSDFAVFYRTNAQSRVFEDTLRKERLPHIVVGTVRFYERKEVKDVLSYLRLALNPLDSISLKRIINVPHRGIGDTTVKLFEAFAKKDNISLWDAIKKASILDLPPRTVRNIKEFISLIEDISRAEQNLSGAEIVKKTLNESGYISWLESENTFDSRERLRNLKELVSAVSEYCAQNPDESIGSFLSNVALLSDVDEWSPQKTGGDSVTLMTLHLAKGLEFNTVFIAGMEEGLFPLSSSIIEESPEELEEERRLCYVGITRAKTKLFLTHAETRRLYGQIRWNLPSRFIEETRLTTSAASQMDEFEIEPDETSYVKLKVGDRIKHPDFGVGRVLRIDGYGETLKVTVVFNDGTVRKLLAKYANLDVVK
ncbi:MAG: UvrD-helicase domain-containing protein [Elusimicrobiota bacterium]